MKTTDLFSRHRSAQRLNESLTRLFGTQLDFATFDTVKLEDARNKLRTQIHTARTQSGFNETIENETLTKAQFMHDAIVAELMDRQEHIVDTAVAEGPDIDRQQLMMILQRLEQNMMEIGAYGDPDFGKILAALNQGDVESAVDEVYGNYSDQDGGEIRSNEFDAYIEDLENEFKDMVNGNDNNANMREGENDEVASVLGRIADEEDFEKLYDLFGDRGPVGEYLQDQIADITGETGLHPKDDFEQIEGMVMDRIQQEFGGQNDDEGGETDDAYALSSAGFGSDEDYESIEQEATGRDAYERDYVNSVSGMGGRERENDEGNTEPPNNFAVAINGKQWKVFKGRGQYADDDREQAHYQQLKDMARRKSEATGKKWTVSITGAPATESIQRTQGESMSNLREGEVQQASAIVTAKTMVDRVSRWIEELSGMENDTLLQLGDSIRDEMGQEQAKGFISSVAPAIQQALENLKTTRETLATGVRQLTGEEQGAEMLGNEPGADMGADDMGPAEPDAMNTDAGADEFAAAEPAAGGLGDAGREQRESINRSSSLLRMLAG